MTYNYFLKDNLIKVEKILSIVFLIFLIGCAILNFTVDKVVVGYLTAYTYGGFAVIFIYYKVIHSSKMEE